MRQIRYSNCKPLSVNVCVLVSHIAAFEVLVMVGVRVGTGGASKFNASSELGTLIRLAFSLW